MGPFESAARCQLRFGLAWTSETRNDAATSLRLSIRQGEVETLLATVTPPPGVAGSTSWSDHRVDLPQISGSPWSVVAEVTDASSDPARPELLWSSPHLLCDRPATPRPTQRPDIVLISIDTLRPDHLGLYGYGMDTSPMLDRFAARSLVFESSIAPAPYTLPSHATMLTGLLPEEHRAGHDHQNHPVDPQIPAVAGLLRAAGYRTLAFTGGGLISRSTGLDRGFDEWTERWTQHKRANLGSVLPEVLDALGAAGEAPVFLFLHTFDVHGPYQQPEAERLFRGENYRTVVAADDWRRITSAPHHAYHQLGRFAGLSDVLAAYDSGIRLVDRRLEALFDYLQEVGRFDNSLIIVTSDHGESLFEHGRYISHGHTLHDVELRTPLIVKPPGPARPARSRRLVGLVDVVPTILDAVGLRGPPGLSGQSLLDERSAERVRTMLGESGITGARFVRTPKWKVIAPTGAFWNRRRFELFGAGAERFETGWQIYDLVDDPQELENLATQASQGDGELQGLFALLRSTDPPGRLADNDVALDDDLLESLRSLGYVQ
jgi:arylsulfatase A-like enzyme